MPVPGGSDNLSPAPSAWTFIWNFWAEGTSDRENRNAHPEAFANLISRQRVTRRELRCPILGLNRRQSPEECERGAYQTASRGILPSPVEGRAPGQTALVRRTLRLVGIPPCSPRIDPSERPSRVLRIAGRRQE